jgi:16S rRNA (guanine1207-N2)-methyltransferase
MPEDHYFSSSPAAPSRPHEVELSLPDVRINLLADRGVFAARGVDPGTVVLLRAIPTPPQTGDLLDLGCGYGPIACTLALRSPLSTVWAVDVNQRALSLTAANAERVGASNVRPVPPESTPDGVAFAGIWSNPPIRVGKAALHELLASWLPRMAPGGLAWLVVHHHLGGDSLARWLEGEGWAVARVASRKGYRVLRVGRR